MVIAYSIKELTSIGEMVVLKDCISASSNNQSDDHLEPSSTTPAINLIKKMPYKDYVRQEFPKFREKYALASRYQDEEVRRYHKNQSHSQGRNYPIPLFPSVADFFIKAEQNFHSETHIDPTKVRRLSEIEAELFYDRQPANS